MRTYGELINQILRLTRWIGKQGGNNKVQLHEQLSDFVDRVYIAICKDYGLPCSDLDAPELGVNSPLNAETIQIMEEMEAHFARFGFNPTFTRNPNPLH